MDPISIFGLVVEVGQVLASVINYAQAVKDAKSDIRRLSEELFTLKGILEHLSTGLGDHSPDPEKQTELDSSPRIFDKNVMSRVLYATDTFLQTLLKELEEPVSRFKKLKQKLEWPFSQDQFNAHLTRLERVKSWLILVITADAAVVERDLHREVTDLARDLREDLRLRDLERVEKDNETLFKWLAPISPADSHIRASSGRRQQTGRWFTKSYLKNWLEDSSEKTRLLCLVAGTGKTTLFAQAVEELTVVTAGTSISCFAYFYCTITDTASQVAVNALGSIAGQLARSIPALLDELRSIYEKLARNQAHKPPIGLSDLEDAIVRHSTAMSQVVILVDALNESSETGSMEFCLLNLTKRSPNIRVVVTTTSTRMSTRDVKFLNIRADTMKEDIKAAIRYRLEHENALRHLAPKFQAEITENLLNSADGSFRWVQLSLDNLCSQRTAKAMRLSLSNLPSTLREMYVDTLKRIDPSDVPLVREALFWLSFVKQPLSLRRLNEAVILEDNCTMIDEDMMLLPRDILLRIGQGLISADQAEHVNLAHSSVKEFLTSEWIRSSSVSQFALDPSTADTIILRKCLQYLCLDNFKYGYGEYRKHGKVRAFLFYAATFWPVHASRCVLGHVERDLIARLFASRDLPRRGNYGVWMEALIPGVKPATIEGTNPLYYAASFGMASVVKAMLESDPTIDVNAPGGRVGATPVFAAAWRGNNEVVEILLKAGANPTILDPGTQMSVVHLAKWKHFKPLRDILVRCNQLDP
ncbi:hypothetical protein N7539_009278 [Penicillium diatomitis]|uniref:NACHT domain-containing protein n=1 Tax=Penicillium diatomitis TaxID=2819901 RepID=A0A9W9WLH3_9EURO|nr:uncharacterized protein N7539_009278 [Penicillium diatomitis]KAJ5469660.1 hypothetical protein N7539_009278 [Penicillium diatomitis]